MALKVIDINNFKKEGLKMNSENDMTLHYDFKIEYPYLIALLDNMRYRVDINTWSDKANFHLNAAIHCMYNWQWGDSDLQVCYERLAEELKNPTPFKCKIARVTNSGKHNLFNGKALLRGLHRNKDVVFIDLVGVH